MIRPQLTTGQIIGTCGHWYTAIIDPSDWPTESYAYIELWAEVGPIVRDIVPCVNCQEGRTPEWDRTSENRQNERCRRAAEARQIATSLGLPQTTIDRAASYGSDIERFDSPMSAVVAAIAADRNPTA
jgi:hypothetical protein